MIIKVIERIVIHSLSGSFSGRVSFPDTVEIDGSITEWHYEDTENPSYIELWSCHA